MSSNKMGVNAPVPTIDELSAMTMDQLREVGEAYGILIDKRWQDKRVRATLINELHSPDLDTQADAVIKDTAGNVVSERKEDQSIVGTIRTPGESGDNVRELRADEPAPAGTQAERLHRVIVRCMHPSKASQGGTIVTVGSSLLASGFMSRYVDFDVPDGVYLPEIIVNFLKEARFVAPKTVMMNGEQQNVIEYLPMYRVDELPYHTMEELEELARQQSMNGLYASQGA